MGVRKCASGERLVHMCDFHRKALKSHMSSRRPPEPYFRLTHTNAAFEMELWLDYFFKSATPILCLAPTDWKPAAEHTTKTTLFLEAECDSYFCYVFAPRAACQFMFLVEF